MTWKKHVLDKTDREKMESMNEGYRHDITGKDHPDPFETTKVVEDGVEKKFLLENGLLVTVSDETALEHYRKRRQAQASPFEAEEMLRRYRFSVVINKLTETLYRLQYELDSEGEFCRQVRMCNRASEDSGANVLLIDKGEVTRAYGIVEHAMRRGLEPCIWRHDLLFFQ